MKEKLGSKKMVLRDVEKEKEILIRELNALELKFRERLKNLKLVSLKVEKVD